LKEKGSSLSMRKRLLTTTPLVSLECDIKEAAGEDCQVGSISGLCSWQPDFFTM